MVANLLQTVILIDFLSKGNPFPESVVKIPPFVPPVVTDSARLDKLTLS